ncbi:MAG: NAD(P)/FAD-dependent oxidoreductase, partial [Methanobacteriota archaeon]
MIFDVLIVGGGVVGCAIARELSRFELGVCLLEREADVSCGTSGANSGVVHSGLKETSGMLKARYCVEGNVMFPSLCEELDVPFRRCGTMVVAVSEGEVEGLEGEFAQAVKNGVPGDRRLSRQEVSVMEPNASAMEGIFAPTGGIVSPYELTIALAENAVENGGKVVLNAEVTGIERKGGYFKVSSSRGAYSARVVVNSTGVSAGKVARMAGIERKTYACRGEYCILDKRFSGVISRMVYPVPPKRVGGFGVHLTPTTHGNILIGPTDEYMDDGSNLSTTKGKQRELLEGARRLIPSLDVKAAIHEYAGMRAKVVPEGSKERGDFIIEDVDGFINLMGIESPGLTAAPRIAQHVVELVAHRLELKP